MYSGVGPAEPCLCTSAWLASQNEQHGLGHCATGMELMAAGAHDAKSMTTDAGYEMVVGGNAEGGGGRILGHRQFARYYRQKYRAGDPRRSMAVVSSVLSQCASTLSACPCQDWHNTLMWHAME